MSYRYIQSNGELTDYLNLFEDKKNVTIALDTEAELNLHAYGETLCLVQIFDGANQVLIDPFKINRALIKSLFENRNIMKVIYDAASDMSLLKNAYDIEVKSILDLRPAVTLLQMEKQDLHSVVFSELGVLLQHKAKFQKHNWTRRPISPEAIDYALSDVNYLLPLKDSLMKKLFENGLMDSYILNNLKIQNKNYLRDPRKKYTRINGYEKLGPDEKKAAREIGRITEKYARQFNLPSYRILNKKDIPEIVKNPDYLDRIRLSDRFSPEARQSILSELKAACVYLKKYQ